MRDPFDREHPEPSLDDMLADPVIRAVMVRDGVTEEEVRNVLSRTAARMWWRQQVPAAA